jgi:hypothetical protein
MTTEFQYLLPVAIFLVVLLIAHYLFRSTPGSVPESTLLKELLPAASAGLLGYLGLWGAEHLLSIRFLAPNPAENPAAEASPWSGLAYFVTLVIGMLAQALWQAIQRRRGQHPPAFDKWEFIKPALVAPIVFLAVYHNISEPKITTVMLLFSFQNGFFWQTVLRKP